MPITGIKLIYYLSQPMYVRIVNTFICNIVRVLVRNIVPVNLLKSQALIKKVIGRKRV